MARPSRPGLKRFARAALVVGVRVAPLAGVGLVAWMVIGGLPLFTGRSSSARRGDLLPARVGRRRAARACRRPRGPVRRRGLLAQGRPLPPVRRRLAGGEDPGPATVRRLRQTGAAFRPSSRGRASPRPGRPLRAGRRGDRADGIGGAEPRHPGPNRQKIWFVRGFHPTDAPIVVSRRTDGRTGLPSASAFLISCQ
jgi:hypothetical protein